MLSIREYRHSDKESVIALIQSLQDLVAAMDPLRLNKHGPAFLAARYVASLMDRTAREKGAIYVAEQSGQVIGCIGGVVGEEQEDLETYRTLSGRILDLVVASEHRGNQVGKKLMVAMEKYFNDSHCNFVRVECFGYNNDAHRFYETCGYHDRSIDMIKRLS